MDWSRAKSILIVAFLGLDLFLGWQLVLQRQSGEAAGIGGVAPNPAQVAATLALSGIVYGGDPPEAPQNMSLLRVAYAPLDREKIVAELIPEGVASQHTVAPTQAENWAWGEERVWFFQDPTIIYYTRSGPSECPAPTVADARQIADTFFATRLGGVPGGATYDLARPEGEGSCRVGVYYRQQFHAFPIWGVVGPEVARPVSGPIKVEVDAGQVESLVGYLLDPLGPSGPPQPILSWDAALLRLDQVLAPEEGMEVASVRVGYFADVYCQARSYEIPPVWQVQLQSGDVFYVNAYTGEVEGTRRQVCQTTFEGSR